MKQLKQFLSQLLQDKNNSYSLREVVVVLFVAVIIVSWIAQQFFRMGVPEFMFWSFVTMVGTGVFGYSFEKRGSPTEKDKTEA